MYTMQVDLFGVNQRVTWDDGILSGDARAVRCLVSLAPSSSVFINGMPRVEGDAILENGVATFLLAKQLFDDTRIVEGDLPDLDEEDVPEGMVS